MERIFNFLHFIHDYTYNGPMLAHLYTKDVVLCVDFVVVDGVDEVHDSKKNKI